MRKQIIAKRKLTKVKHNINQKPYRPEIENAIWLTILTHAILFRKRNQS